MSVAQPDEEGGGQEEMPGFENSMGKSIMRRHGICNR